MAHVAIENVIMLPLLVLQVILFPMVANWLMNIWVDSRRTLALEEVANNIGSTIQQMYFTLDHATIKSMQLSHKPDVPKYIEGSFYVGNATIKQSSSGSQAKILELTLTLSGTKIAVKRTIVLGPNAEWIESLFISNSDDTCIYAEKYEDGTIRLSFSNTPPGG